MSASAKLISDSYGKSHVRLTKVTRGADGRHDLKELSVDIKLAGDFSETYLTGDNAKIVATDSMKNTVYVLAKENRIDSVEGFAGLLATHFASTYPQVAVATVRVEQRLWNRIAEERQTHPHAFVAGGDEARWSQAVARSGPTAASPALVSGIAGLSVLKTTGSAFKGFVRDRYRTLADAEDRIFATIVEADWDYAEPASKRASDDDLNSRFDAIRAAMIRAFAAHKSLSVQQTMYAMGEAAIGACGALQAIRMTMPNQHRIPFNLAPFGLSNDNEIFVPTDEPFGLIKAEIRRAT